MILWLNGAFGAGKTTTAYELQRRLEDSFVYDPENVGFFLRKNLPVEQVVERIGQECALPLLPDKRSGLARRVGRLRTVLAHIRR